eukprot:CAMPEP_0113678790 /NCGR_PEP_ID=MMETSP0038_2-20120614/10180_1 /TAXON_ID=2898 /ORGANISM="Cryptomonas paramecium" /LENGTH=106 /DNA_ID=CAMNT_0000596541 /DNA_START=1405 /DNA_END=1724 /DNA_ORIENTATION=+ /assembly_acc=CAM_ASM_000170
MTRTSGTRSAAAAARLPDRRLQLLQRRQRQEADGVGGAAPGGVHDDAAAADRDVLEAQHVREALELVVGGGGGGAEHAVARDGAGGIGPVAARGEDATHLRGRRMR